MHGRKPMIYAMSFILRRYVLPGCRDSSEPESQGSPCLPAAPSARIGTDHGVPVAGNRTNIVTLHNQVNLVDLRFSADLNSSPYGLASTEICFRGLLEIER